MNTKGTQCASSADPSNASRDFGLGWWAAQREQFPGFELIPHLFRLLFDSGPVTVESLAVVSSWSKRDVEAALRQHPSVEWDEQNRVVGFGLTLRTTPHRFTSEGRTVFAFCASDTLVFPIVLGRPGLVESVCPATAQPVRVDVTPQRVVSVEPPSAVVSLVRPQTVGDVRAEVCGLGHFFASRDAAAPWLAAHPEGKVHSVQDDFQLHRDIMERLGWAQAPREEVGQPPLACNIDAIPASERTRYVELRRRIFEHTQNVVETPEGFCVILNYESRTMPLLGEWIAFEHVCCPFLRFAVHVDETGPIRLELSGREGVKDFLRVELTGGGLLATDGLRARERGTSSCR